MEAPGAGRGRAARVLKLKGLNCTLELGLKRMKQPIRIIIHVPLREERDYRKTLVGLKHALCVSVDGAISTYDLLPSFRPRKGQEHLLVEHLAAQLVQGWTIMVWDKDTFLRDCGQIVARRLAHHPRNVAQTEFAWDRMQSSDSELMELGAFEKFPNGHFIALVAAKENFDESRHPDLARRARRMVGERLRRPASEEFWGVLCPLLLAKFEATKAMESYSRWVKANRPQPPQHDVSVQGS